MRNIIIIITYILMISCTSDNTFDNTPVINNSIKINTNDILLGSSRNIDILNFNYKNHQYLYFIPYASLEHGTIVHDPDCPCLKQ